VELGTKPRPSGGCSNTNGGSKCECELAGAREPGGRREANPNGERKTAAVTATAAAMMTMAAAAAVQYYSDGSSLPPLFYFIFYFT